MARWDTYTDEVRIKTFIEKAQKAHGDKYDYSKVTAEQLKNKLVCIICPKHGEFWQNPSNHVHNHGCRSCGAEITGAVNKVKKVGKSPANRMYNQDFIEKAKKIHKNLFSYEKTTYEYAKKPITVTCNVCNRDFNCLSTDFLKPDYKCPHCKKTAKIEEEKKIKALEFLQRAREIHGDKYDYSKVEYANVHTKVCIICPEHGEFWQTPSKHLAGQGCKRCKRPNEGMTKEEFIKKARNVHGDKYDYSEVIYVNATTKVKIICHEKDICGREHGAFYKTPSEHINSGDGCNKCRVSCFDKETFIKKARNVHGDKYDYSKVEYVNTVTPVTIICPEHGEFKQKPEYHLTGKGCTICNIGYTLSYKFNLLNEFVDEFRLRDFLMTNDENLIYIILRNIEKIDPKFNPIVKDIDRVLRSDSTNPIGDLEDKYRTSDEIETTDSGVEEVAIVNIDDIDLDDDDAVEAFISSTTTTVEKTEPTIEDLTRARENEINLINTIEHMLTPEDRQFIKDKFLNDKRRNWMLERDKKA